MFIFIVNPSSGDGQAFIEWQKVKEILKRRGVEYNVKIGGSAESARGFIRQHIESSKVEAVVVIGGDGTLNAALQEVVNTDIAITMFPTGSGNDIARTFNFTKNHVEFIDRLMERKISTFDCIQVNQQYGISVVGAGLDATIGARVNRSRIKRLLNKLGIGSLSYTLAAFITFFSFKPFLGSITIDGNKKTLHNGWLIACGNTSLYGGGLPICPNASPSDGIINITMLYNVNRFRIIFQLFPKLLKGPVYKEGVIYLTGKDILIETDTPIPAIIDGEEIGSTPLQINIVPQSLHLIDTSNSSRLHISE